jgi:Protein phosphatase 2A regulatory B subunit (B56 family)
MLATDKIKKRDKKGPITYEEMVNVGENEHPAYYLAYLYTNIGRTKITEGMFAYIIRKIKPYLYSISDYSENSISPNDRKDVFCKIEQTVTPKNCIAALRALNIIFSNLDLSFERVSLYFGEKDIVMLVDHLKNSDEKVRKLCQDILEIIFEDFKRSTDLFKEIIANELIEFRNKNRSFEGIYFLLEFSSGFANAKELDGEAEEYFIQYVLPVFFCVPVWEQNIVFNVLGDFCYSYPECQRVTLRYFCKIYNRVTTIDQTRIFYLTALIIEIYNQTAQKDKIEDLVGDLILNALRSESHIVVDALINLLDSDSVKAYIEPRISVILPKIFFDLYKSGKKFWKQEQKLKLLKIVNYILMLDQEVFANCLYEHNYNKYEKAALKSPAKENYDDERYFNNKRRYLAKQLQDEND